MKNTVFIALIAATSISLAAGSAFAKGNRHGAPIDFEILDSDGDGKVTLEEMQAHGAARLAKVDADGDGFLTLPEIEAAASERAKQRASRMMDRLDADEDGKISAEELENSGRAERRFQRADKDGDGAVTKAEFDAAIAKMRKHHKGGARSE
ncbi:calcium-binding protein [uncultured Roseobacter sp.]|uniref:EF-hand domain-containing protein n=1 Tax=uncultured Roseobacter sp. TaxID=114847 RepID=UPI00263175C6|nr:calcium-binding protein [uncultured Roseobacter sp.]